jgi:hypothetical protein
MKHCFVACLLGYCLSLPAQDRYQVIIHEIMADPSPSQGLPGQEWIELRNMSTVTINLLGWKLADANAQTGPFPFFELAPDSCVIICAPLSLATLSNEGTAIAVPSFISLDNDGELISLINPSGMTIHAVSYSSSWYDNELKKQGGWTLEMIDGSNPCSGRSNWKVSIDVKGGTPGKVNSVAANNLDTISPTIINSHVIPPRSLVITFDEPVDSSSGSISSNYRLSNGITVRSCSALPPFFNEVQLMLDRDLIENEIFSVAVANITDCQGNLLPNGTEVQTGISGNPSWNDIIINEVLANPAPGSNDYIELYNKSSIIIDVSSLYIANRTSTNSINSPVKISNFPLIILPGAYIVITSSAGTLPLFYFVKYPAAVIQVSGMPSFPDEQGSVVVLNAQGEILDEVKYSSDWHFKLLTNTDGIALERIDPAAPSQQVSNWHSAASGAGYGTPGYQNSQFKNNAAPGATVDIIPKLFSPDNDGNDDIVFIHYQVNEPGYVANTTIFNAQGITVKSLAKNELLSRSGYWAWDGLNDGKQELKEGIYIVLTELFNLKGKKARFKKVVVLSRK